ncbi:MAG: hypothetical protein D6815_10455, partial [Candidatus Dadabacteria bacterium]
MEALGSMTNRAIAFYYTVALVLGLNLWRVAAARAPARETQAERLAPLLDLPVEAIETVRVEKGGEVIVVRRDRAHQGRWRAVVPPNKIVASDLVDALLE